MKYTFVFGFRNREVERVQRCFDSLREQDFKDFEAVLIDFGSDEATSLEVARVCSNYSFARYFYNEVRGLPWNRSYALNTGVRLAKGEYIIFSDVDLIYTRNFLSDADRSVRPDISLYGEYTHLPENFSAWSEINSLDVTTLKGFGRNAKGGLHFIQKARLEQIGSYDEHYCFWGVEDRDLSLRLKKIGVTEVWIEQQKPVYHQWHPVTSDFYNSGFPLQWWEDMNIYFEQNKSNLVRNPGGWGRLLEKSDRPSLNEDHAVTEISLQCKDSIFDEHGKTQVIGTVYSALNDLSLGQRVKFVFKRTKNNNPLDRIITRDLLSRKIVHSTDWQRLKVQFDKYMRRLNHFIPDEDLKYIFWKIQTTDKRFDCHYSEDENFMKWTFALRKNQGML